MTLNQNKHMISLLFYYIYWLFLLCFLLVLVHVVVFFDVSIQFSTVYFGVVCVWCSLGVVNDGNVVYFVVVLLSFSLGFCTFGGVVLLLGL